MLNLFYLADSAVEKKSTQLSLVGLVVLCLKKFVVKCELMFDEPILLA